MSHTDINSEDRLVQQTFADHLEKALRWENVYAWNHETFGAGGIMMNLPRPPYTEEEAQELAGRIYHFVFQQALSGAGFNGRSAA